MELVQIYFKKFNKLAVISHFLSFFHFLFKKNFPPGSGFNILNVDPDPYPGGKMNAEP